MTGAELGMPVRRRSRQLRVGRGASAVLVGGDAPVSVQSMTTTLTADVNATLQQIAGRSKITEAGPPPQGTIKSAVAFGQLLADGIGDTIRVSLSAPPVKKSRPASPFWNRWACATATWRSCPVPAAAASPPCPNPRSWRRSWTRRSS